MEDEEGVLEDFEADLVYKDDVSNISGLPKKLVITAYLVDYGTGVWTVDDIVDEDLY